MQKRAPSLTHLGSEGGLKKLTEAADAESGSARSRGGPAQPGAVRVAVAGAVGAGAGVAGVVLEADDGEEGENWKE